MPVKDEIWRTFKMSFKKRINPLDDNLIERILPIKTSELKDHEKVVKAMADHAEKCRQKYYSGLELVERGKIS
jgi:hypothetical protein